MNGDIKYTLLKAFYRQGIFRKGSVRKGSVRKGLCSMPGWENRAGVSQPPGQYRQCY